MAMMMNSSGVDFVTLFSIPIYILGVFIVVFSILRFLSKASKLAWGIYLTLFLTYSLLFSSLALVTVDIARGLYAKTTLPEDDNIPPKYLIIFWNIVYWSIQVLAWIVIPICQSYNYTGEFTVIRRLWASALENIILYGIMGLAGGFVLGALLIYILIANAKSATESGKIRITKQMVLGIGQSLSNAFGLLLLVSFMGYGVVDLPRYLWQQANKERSMRYYEFQAYTLDETRNDKEITLKELLAQVKGMDSAVKSDHKLRKFVDRILKTCEKELEQYRVRTQTVTEQDVENLQRKHLVKLHKELIQAITELKRGEYQFEYLQDKAFELQDIMRSMDIHNNNNNNNSNGNVSSVQKRIKSPFRKQRAPWLAKLIDYPEWIFYRYFRHIAYRVASVLMCVFALLVVYSEFTPLIVVILKATKRTELLHYISFFSFIAQQLAPYRFILQIFSLVTLLMFASVVLFALFRIEIYSLYKLIPHHSDAGSLCYTAVFLCRVAPTLCYNYLQLVGVQSTDGVAFYHVMGLLKVDGLTTLIKQTGLVEVIAGGFTNFFPMIMIVVSLMTLFRVVDKIALIFGEKRFIFNPKQSNEDIDAGREILNRARERRLMRMNLDDLPDSSSMELQDESITAVVVDDQEDIDLENNKKVKKGTEKKLENIYKKYGRERTVKEERKGFFSSFQ